MSVYDNNLDDDSINKIIKEKEEEQEQYIQEQHGKGIIHNYSNIKNNNENEIDLDIGEELKKKNIIQKFIKHKKHKYLKIELNHKYEKCTIILPTNNIENLPKFRKDLEKEFDRKAIQDNDDRRLIRNVIDNNHELIAGLNENNDNEQREEKTTEQKDNRTSEVLLDLFNEQDPQPVLFKDQFNVPHALVNINDHYEVLPIEDAKFRKYLSISYYDKLNEIPNTEAVRNVIQHLAAKSTFKGDTITLHLRTAWSNNNEIRDSIYYAMSDNKNRCVKITSDGWTILERQTDILFKRYNHQIPQIEPVSVDNLDDKEDVLEQFITLLNIKNYNDRLLLKCYIVSLFIPDIPHVILILLGEQGGAKSTLQELIKMLVDPSITKTFTFPKDTNEFIQQLSHNYLVYYDNVSAIQDWISDLLCRAVTGSSFSKRALYTNDDDIYYSFMRKLGLNGIDLAKINADLSDRSINIKPDRIDKLDRVKLDKIWNQFNAIKPRLLGYIFNILSKVLEYKKTHGEITFPNGLNRMADWEEYTEIISRCMGNPEGEFQRIYQENLSRQVDDAVASSQLCTVVIELIENEENKPNEWQERTPTDLYDKLSDIARYTLKLNNLTNKKYWPQSPGSLSYNLNRVKTILREKGIEVTTGVKNKDGVRVIKLIKLNSAYPSNNNIQKTSSTSSTSSKDEKTSTKQTQDLDDLIKDNGETSSTTSSTESSQNQAQNSNSGRLDDPDDLYSTKEQEETPEEKYHREQEEMKKWDKDLES
jgi:hypothetical protein